MDGFNHPFRNENSCPNQRRNGFSFSSQPDERRSGVYPIFRCMVITVMVLSVSESVRGAPLVLRASLRQQCCSVPPFQGSGILFVPLSQASESRCFSVG